MMAVVNKPHTIQSIELRKQCCHIRKVEPLNRALAAAERILETQIEILYTKKRAATRDSRR